METVESILRIEIEGYAYVNFARMADIVDAVGGVYCDVTYAEAGDANISIEEVGSSDYIYDYGEHIWLNGTQAVAYARVRHVGNGVYERQERQTEVLRSILDQFMNLSASAFNIAVIHTLFNILSTIILMPFCNLIEKLTILSVKPKKKETKSTTFRTLDERFLSVPSFAVETCRQIVSEMAAISKKTMLDSMTLIDNYDEKVAESVVSNESEIDIYEDETSSYLLKISEQDLSQKDSREVSQLLHVVGDVERIADHAVNIVSAAKEIHNKKISFSPEAQHEISTMSNAVREILSLAIEALVNEDLNVAKKVEPLEQIIDKLNHKIKNNHVNRLRHGDCTVELGFVLSDILANFERVADHCSNIAVCLLEIDNNSFQTHEYLHNVKETGANEFFEFYDMYKQRYTL